MSDAIAMCAARGWRLEGAYGGTATMVSGRNVNHVLHLLLTLFTCGLWLFVWFFVAVFAKGERRIVVRSDQDGNISYETPQYAAANRSPSWLARQSPENRKVILGVGFAAAVVLVIAYAVFVTPYFSSTSQ